MQTDQTPDQLLQWIFSCYHVGGLNEAEITLWRMLYHSTKQDADGSPGTTPEHQEEMEALVITLAGLLKYVRSRYAEGKQVQ